MSPYTQAAINPDITFPSCIGIFLFMSLTGYFLAIRGNIAGFIIKEKKLTKKERKQKIEMEWNRSKKDTLKAFVKWLLCLTYSKEQKGRLYPLFIVLNYIYLGVIIVYLFLAIFAFYFEFLQIWCIIILIYKIKILDAPIIFALGVLFFTGKRSNRKKRIKY
ncbi:hypothetical protein [Faecalispora jeddahensis]|uniref:hypothetical protein n=1 Tax=Faecalispora jeddahensis TaxID=1414721 RepID=UPI00145ABE84|nr:hypothetical protein [Faecalispora jeddahensis]